MSYILLLLYTHRSWTLKKFYIVYDMDQNTRPILKKKKNNRKMSNVHVIIHSRRIGVYTFTYTQFWNFSNLRIIYCPMCVRLNVFIMTLYCIHNVQMKGMRIILYEQLPIVRLQLGTNRFYFRFCVLIYQAFKMRESIMEEIRHRPKK